MSQLLNRIQTVLKCHWWVNLSVSVTKCCCNLHVYLAIAIVTNHTLAFNTSHNPASLLRSHNCMVLHF